LKKVRNKPGINKLIKSKNLRLLHHPNELSVIKELIRLPEVIEDTAKDYQVQRIPQYAIELATAFHQFYRDCRVLTEEEDLEEARLALILATKQVLKNTLNLMGISAPERM
jgi:arginyl-tRNA synthetase